MEWISVEDRLPELEMVVVLYFEHSYLPISEKYGYGEVVERRDAQNKTTLNWLVHTYKNHNPSHWMPLPDPPGEVSNE